MFNILSENLDRRNLILKDYELDHIWLEVEDPEDRDLLLKTYFNDTDRKILKSCTDVPRTLMGIIRDSGVPQTTAYRRILELIKNQILVSYDKIPTNESTIPRYIAAIKRFQIQANDFDDINVKILLNHPKDILTSCQ